MIELVPMAYRVVNEVDASSDYRGEKSSGKAADVRGQAGGGSVETNENGTRSARAGVGGAGSKMDEDEERDAVFFRLEMLGYRVGQGMVERCVALFLSSTLCSTACLQDRAAQISLSSARHCRVQKGPKLTETLNRFSRDRPRFTDTLDVIKFLCKDLWMLVFRKQIDNLKTNHRVRFPSLFPALGGPLP
jgi:hypothetical protein